MGYRFLRMFVDFFEIDDVGASPKVLHHFVPTPMVAIVMRHLFLSQVANLAILVVEITPY
jgi:hypothetical protein|tara:strand:+ start:1066 stop:1245 length:180 start_codon:yes stop_codon:yes gene_type:complete